MQSESAQSVVTLFRGTIYDRSTLLRARALPQQGGIEMETLLWVQEAAEPKREVNSRDTEGMSQHATKNRLKLTRSQTSTLVQSYEHVAALVNPNSRWNVTVARSTVGSTTAPTFEAKFPGISMGKT